MIYLLTAIR